MNTLSRKATIGEALSHPRLFGPAFADQSWDGWKAVLKATFAEPLSEAERVIFQALAEREPPGAPVRELWCKVGRGGGKDSAAATIATYVAAFSKFAPHLRPGEVATVVCLAVDRDQAKIVLRYIRGYFETIPELAAMVARQTEESIELNNRSEIVVGTNNFRGVRGKTIVCAIFDEVAFWRSESSANPDIEVDAAITPALARVPGSMKIGISTPHMRSGLMYEKWKRHYGKDGDVLVISAPTRVMNPRIPQSVIDEAVEADPERAAAEWMVEWRTDLAAYIDRRTLESCIAPGRFELAPVFTNRYSAFCDPSGGSADSFTMCVVHVEKEIVVVDAIREQKPPFSPETTISGFADVLKSYRISKVVGDRYGGEFPRELFRKQGITYDLSDRPASDIYRDVLARFNSGKVELLDLPRVVNQFVSLERRTNRSGRDSISHPVGGHDYVANSVAGAILGAINKRGPIQITQADMEWAMGGRRVFL